ncbi:MAG: hypothetical protein R3B72_09350 [Polyangiaceae bacterium]
MHKHHIRSYRVAEHGDLEVVDHRGGESVDLSAHYEDVSRDRGNLRLETCLEVFRSTDGQLVWSASANGQDTGAATSLALLLTLYLEDLSGAGATPRSF